MANQSRRLATLKPRIEASKAMPIATVEGKEWSPNRGSSTQRGYGYKWQQARNGYLGKHPLCRHCQAKGLVTLATDVDHIDPHRGDMQKFWDTSNWQPLCHSCHSIKTASEDGGFGNYGRGGVS